MGARETLFRRQNPGSEKGGVTKGTAQIWPPEEGNTKTNPCNALSQSTGLKELHAPPKSIQNCHASQHFPAIRHLPYFRRPLAEFS